jgi:hypothetical protein
MILDDFGLFYGSGGGIRHIEISLYIHDPVQGDFKFIKI